MNAEEQKRDGLLDEVKNEVDRRLAELAWEEEQRKEILEEIDKDTPAETAELKALSVQADAINKRWEEVTDKRMKKAAALWEALRAVENGVAQKSEGLKRYLHSLPPEVLESSGFSVKAHGWNVSVTKAQFETRYETDRLIKAMPELEEMYVDGDPVLKKTISPEVLERLVAKGDIKEEEIAPFRIVSKLRNPSVTIQQDLRLLKKEEP